jgi:hypothetical protein
VPRSEEEEGGEARAFMHMQGEIIRKAEPLQTDDFGRSGGPIMVGGRPVVAGDVLVGRPTPSGRWKGDRERDYTFVATLGSIDRAGSGFGLTDYDPHYLVAGMVLGEWDPDEPNAILTLQFPAEGLRRPTETVIAEAA